MSAEKIQELESRTTRLETILEGVLIAVEKSTHSTEKLTVCVTEMTAKLSVVIDDNKEHKDSIKAIEKRSLDNETEIKIIKQSNLWQGWVGKTVVVAIAGAILISIGLK